MNLIDNGASYYIKDRSKITTLKKIKLQVVLSYREKWGTKNPK